MNPKYHTIDTPQLRDELGTALDTIRALTAELTAANARAVTLAADLSAATQTANELRWQLRIANRRDAGHSRPVGEWERLARTLVDSAPVWFIDGVTQ